MITTSFESENSLPERLNKDFSDMTYGMSKNLTPSSFLLFKICAKDPELYEDDDVIEVVCGGSEVNAGTSKSFFAEFNLSSGTFKLSQ